MPGMVLFFVIAASMVIAAVAAVALPMVRARINLADKRDKQNIFIARERLQLIEAQVRDGSLSPEQAEQQKAEVELALLDDVARDETQGGQPSAPSGRGRWGGIAVAAAVPVLTGVLYLYLGQPQAVTPGAAQPIAQAEGPHSEEEFSTMVQALEQRLLASPEDTQGWYVLANSYMTLEQFDKAASAFARLRELAGDDPDLLVRHADALAMAQGGVLAGEPERLILAALEQRPDHPVGLWLAGIAAQRRGDLATALEYWRRAEPLFADDPGSQGELRSSIAQAERSLAGGVAGPVAAAETPSAPQSTDGRVAASAGAIEVSVSLDPALRDKVSDDDTLFVLARAVSGPPMPLAVVRKQVRDLPLEVTLNDTMAMMPQMKLSNFGEVSVIARVSKSGQAETRSGDLIGQVSPVSPGHDGAVEVVISKPVP